MEPQDLDLRVICQIPGQCHRHHVLPLGDKHSCKGQQVILTPIPALEQLQGGVAQSVDGRLKDVDGLAVSGNGERVVLVAAGQLAFVVSNTSPDIAVSGNASLVIAQEYGTVVFPGFKEQIIFQTLADDDIMDAPVFEIMNHSIRIAVPFREQQLF